MARNRRQNRGAAQPQPIPGGVIQGPVSYQPMIKAKERRAIQLRQVFYRIVKRFAAPAANGFLIANGKPSAGKIDSDFQNTMMMIKKKVLANPKFLKKPMSTSQLLDVSIARNVTDHDDFPEIWNNETKHFSILKDFCESVGSPSAATDVQRIWNHIHKGEFIQALSFRFTFTPVYDENVAFSLCEIIYAVISKYLTFAMWDFRSRKYPLATNPPPIDAYANLKFFQAQQLLDVNYLAPDGAARDDTRILKESMNARIENRHSAAVPIFNSSAVPQRPFDNFYRLANSFGLHHQTVGRTWRPERSASSGKNQRHLDYRSF